MAGDHIFTYETYQDVRRNLFKYSAPVLILAGFATYGFILPNAHRDWVYRILQQITTTEPWKSILGIGAGFAMFSAIAFVMVEVIKVHDRWYDRYIVRWRENYDVLFILPRLLQPFMSRTNQRLWEEAIRNRDNFLERLYYPYVGDQTLRIPKNRLVRFYEVITVYWLTQVNEIVMLVLLILAGGYSLTSFPRNDHSYAVRLLWTVLGIIVLLALNRLWIRSERQSVANATIDEIQAVHDDENLKADLQTRFRAVCDDYGVPYE